MSSKNTNLFAPESVPGLEAPVERFECLGSTNNYAIQLIDADKAEHGMTILAGSQNEGKGQRGKGWIDTPGESLLMSLIVEPTFEIAAQPHFLATSAVAVVDVLKKHLPDQDIQIKWPNDIIIADKKAGGMLIENVLRGQNWAWAVIGLGINISQIDFPDDLPHATSLMMASGRGFDRDVLALEIRRSILGRLTKKDPGVWEEYNSLLYKRGEFQQFNNDGKMYNAKVLEVNAGGQLGLRDYEGKMKWVNHGKLEWVW